MIVSVIAAMDKNHLIGIGLKMPWHLPKDFSYFKKTTTGHPIIMGRLTFESIGCRPLPNRHHIIVSSNPELDYGNPNVSCVTTIEDAIALASTFDSDEVFICGGGQIYEYSLKNKLVDKLYITSINTNIDVDSNKKESCVYFPEFGQDNWDLIQVDNQEADEKNTYDMAFLVFERNF